MPNQIFEGIYLYDIFNSKAIKIGPNQHAGLLRFLWKLDENSLKIKKGLELVFRPHFSYNLLIRKFYFAMLHKLAKFHHQTVFTSQVIQLNMFCISCLGTWWRHDIWISKKLKFDYLKNEKSFWSKIKIIFPCFTTALF